MDTENRFAAAVRRALLLLLVMIVAATSLGASTTRNLDEGADAWCAAARAQEDAESRIVRTTMGMIALPDSITVARCHVDALVAGARADEAYAFARQFRDDHPRFDEAHSLLLSLSTRMRRHAGGASKIVLASLDSAPAAALASLGRAAPTLETLTADFERFAREIDTVTAHVIVAAHEAEIGFAAVAARRLEALAGRALNARQRMELCQGLESQPDLFPGNHLEACWRRVLFARGDETLGPANSAAIESAREALFTLAFEGADWANVDALLMPLDASTRLRFWSDHWFDDTASCTKLRADLASGWLDPGIGFERERNIDGLVAMFRRCGMRGEAADWSLQHRVLHADDLVRSGAHVIVTPRAGCGG